MDLDFAALLVLATLLSGVIWGLDAWLWAPKRRASAVQGEAGGQAAAAPAKEPVIVEYARSFFPILLAVLVLRSFIVEPFRIPSGSMLPTLEIGDFILVNKFSYGLRLPVSNTKIADLGSPERGDVVVFRFPGDPKVDYIKRVVGVPGDQIRYVRKRLLVNGQPVGIERVGEASLTPGVGNGSYDQYRENLDGKVHSILVHKNYGYAEYPCLEGDGYRVPVGHYFVMGDNRDNSNDSRFWCGVPEANLVGKAFFIWMNWNSDRGGIGWQRIGNSID